MEQLIDRIVATAGIGREPARKALSVLISYLSRAAPAEKMAPILAAFPGVETLIARPKGGLMGLFGGGLMAAYGELSAAGLSTDQMKTTGETILAAAREKAGKRAVDELLASVPMLRQLL